MSDKYRVTTDGSVFRVEVDTLRGWEPAEPGMTYLTSEDASKALRLVAHGWVPVEVEECLQR